MLYAGQSAWVPARETEAQLLGRRLSAKCLVVCTNLHSNPGRPRAQMGRPRGKGVKPLTQGPSPSEGQGPGKCHGPDLWPAWFCTRGTLVPQEGHSRAPQHGAGWEAPRLGFAASGASRAGAYVPPQPGGAGGGPIRAPSQNLPLPPGNSRLPPLPGLGPASTHMPTPGGCPAPPSKSSRAV